METVKKGKSGGFTLVEVVIAMVILSIVALGTMSAFQFLSKNSIRTSDATFATEKAIQMMEELRAVSDATNVANLDNYNDDIKGPAYYSPILTTLKEVTDATPADPAHPLSGNAGGRYSRRVIVLPVAADDSVRRVAVRIYKEPTKELLAESVSLLRSSSNARVPTQQLDVYLLGFENVMGYWTKLDSLRPTFNAVVDDLVRRNPNLQIKCHYINRLAFGRDPFYAPYLNNALRSDALNLAEAGVYYYPGHVVTDDPSGSVQPDDYFFYPVNNITGRVNVDDVLQSSAVSSGLFQYTMPDRYNHAVRYPDEVAMYAQYVAAAKAARDTIPEPSWRMILEDLNTDPEKYRNAIFINLHGAITPLPPMRNYSDPAKDPGTNPFKRVVTHPENLEYADNISGRNADPINLRVYSFLASSVPYTGSFFNTLSTTSISVVLTNIGTGNGLAAGDITVYRATGSTTQTYSWSSLASSAGGDYELDMHLTYTKITLRNSPLHNGLHTTVDNTGLNNGAVGTDERLYGWEYIPCLVSSTSFFNPAAGGSGANRFDLTDTARDVPKNTARWVIRIAADKLVTGTRDTPYVVETVIGESPVVGAGVGAFFMDAAPVGASPSNISRTYFWVTDPAVPGSRAPYTERFQYLGDPRHMPYVDVKAAEGYNWFFQNAGSLAMNAFKTGYGGFSRSSGTWKGGDDDDHDMIYDVPRLLGTLREGLMKSNSFFTTMANGMGVFLSVGGDIASQQAGGYSGLMVKERLWNPASGINSVKTVHEIKDETTSAQINAMKLIVSTRGDWFGRDWLGELYPDPMYGDWSGATGGQVGNLPVGVNNNSRFFCRAIYNGLYENKNWFAFTTGGGAVLDSAPVMFLASSDSQGGTSFFNGSQTPTDNTKRFFNAFNGSADLALSAVGVNAQNDLGTPLYDPLTSSGMFINLNKNFANTAIPSEWLAYASSRTTLSVGEQYYNDPKGFGSVYIRCWRDAVRGGSGDTQVAHVVLNNLSPQTDNPASYMAKLALLTSVRAFTTAGQFVAVDGLRHVAELPYVAISTPAAYNDIKLSKTPTIQLGWDTAWGRWDSPSAAAPTPYTETYPTPFPADPNVSYNVKISTDNGGTWTFIGTNVKAVVGQYDDTKSVVSPQPLNLAALGARGGVYLARVEAYRRYVSPVTNNPAARLHYSYHERDIHVSP